MTDPNDLFADSYTPESVLTDEQVAQIPLTENGVETVTTTASAPSAVPWWAIAGLGLVAVVLLTQGED